MLGISTGHDRRLVQHLAKKSMATIAVATVGLEAGQQVVDGIFQQNSQQIEENAR